MTSTLHCQVRCVLFLGLIIFSGKEPLHRCYLRNRKCTIIVIYMSYIIPLRTVGNKFKLVCKPGLCKFRMVVDWFFVDKKTAKQLTNEKILSCLIYHELATNIHPQRNKATTHPIPYISIGIA